MKAAELRDLSVDELNSKERDLADQLFRMRIQKAIAIYTLAQQNPSAFDQKAVYGRIFSMIGIEDADDLFSKEPPGPPPVIVITRSASSVGLSMKY